MSSYKQVKVGDLTLQSLKKAAKGGVLSIPASKMSGNRVMLIHPLNYDKFQKAKKANRGVRLQIAPGEINADLEYHENTGAGMHGGSVWSWIKQKAWPWVKKNLYPVLRPVISQAVDQGAQMLGTYTGQPGLVNVVRGELKNQTGLGLSGKVAKGSQAAKDKMKALRAMRGANKSSGGSFRL